VGKRTSGKIRSEHINANKVASNLIIYISSLTGTFFQWKRGVVDEERDVPTTIEKRSCRVKGRETANWRCRGRDRPTTTKKSCEKERDNEDKTWRKRERQ
jgi:hypothetical protein